MLNKFFKFKPLFSLVCLLSVFNTKPVMAQQCNANFETLTSLHHPEPGSYTVWDALYGDEHHEEAFVSAVAEGRDVLAVGEVLKGKGDKPKLLFVRYDYRGRVTKERTYNIDRLSEVVKALPYKDGYVVLANKAATTGKKALSASFWLGFFDKDFVLKSQKTIQDKSFNLYAKDFIPSIGDTGWTVSATTERTFGSGEHEQSEKIAAVYLLDLNGNELSSRAYILGKNNEILGLSKAKFDDGNESYIATGYFENSIGKSLGWALRLTDNISMVWQKEYSRGLSAQLKHSFGYKNRYVLVFGDVLPVNGEAVGSWLMLLDSVAGRTMWQRYYHGKTGRHHYYAQDLDAAEDGLITLMMSAKLATTAKMSDEKESAMSKSKSKENEEEPAFKDTNIPENMNFTHLLTLSPRGVTLAGDAYYYGQGASLSQLVMDEKRRRVMPGYTLVSPNDFERKAEEKKPTNEPLTEFDQVNLPDVELSDKAKAGLDMLKNKLKENAHHTDAHEKPEQKDSVKKMEAHAEMADSVVTSNGWLAIGDAPDPYSDPCVRANPMVK